MEGKRITIKEAAEILGVHENTVRDYINRKVLTGYQIVPKGSIRIDESQVRGLIDVVKGE